MNIYKVQIPVYDKPVLVALVTWNAVDRGYPTGKPVIRQLFFPRNHQLY